MANNEQVSRRNFVTGVAAALGYATLRPESLLFAQGRGRAAGAAGAAAQGAVQQQAQKTLAEAIAEYDGFAKIANNENPYGPPPSVMKAMNDVWKYSNRYGYPDPDLTGEIAKMHNVPTSNVLITAGSGEVLTVVGSTFLSEHTKKVVGAEVTYMSVYTHATNIKAQAITVPLKADYSQDIPAIIRATKKHYREVGFVYICNPNNPTGRIVPKAEIKQLIDALPEDMPILIDEAYHHFIEDPQYETAEAYVREGRNVIVARTFSKISALAGMRLGYCIAPNHLIAKMRPYSTGSVSALVKYGGVAALKDKAAEAEMKRVNAQLRKQTVAELKSMGYDSIPSEANFFMVGIKRPVQPIIEEFKKKGVLVGRPFPPMTEHMRVSVGTADEMQRFTKAFREIFTAAAAPTAGRGGRPTR
jgi:histidinol-phosphate aminotransferase